MSNITPLNFDFESHAVRFVSHEPLLIVAADICSIFGLDTSLAVNGRTRKAEDGTVYRDGGLDDDEKGTAIVSTPGGEQEVLVVNEPGLYRLIFKCRKKVAKRFQRWVFHEVLPTIRKTGKYELAQAPSPSPTPELPTPTLEQISDLVDLTLGKAGLDPKLVAGVKLNAVAKHYPTLAQTAEEAKSLLAIPLESQLLTPKQLGEIIHERTGEKWSSQRVNKKLIELGLQEHNPDGDPDYLATEIGEAHSKVVLATAKGHGRSCHHLRWYESVLETIEL